MTRTAHATIAGFALLFYIGAGMSGLVLERTPATAGLIPLFTSLSALILGVTFFALTKEVNRDLALFALICRVVEGIPNLEGSIYFSIGSLIFAWLFLRGRILPTWLALLGVVASALLVVFLPFQAAGYFGGLGNWRDPITWYAWLPMLAFEVTLAFWLLLRARTGLPLRQATSS